MKSLLLFFILSILSSTCYSGGLDQCFSKLITIFKSRQRITQDFPQKTIDILKQAKLGDKVEFTYKGKLISGHVKKIDFNILQLEKNYSLKKIREFKVLETNKDNKIPLTYSFMRQKRKELDTWKSLSLTNFKLMTDEAKTAEQERLSSSIENKIKEKYGIVEIGLHFNLNGGQAYEYANSGIKFSRGDISLQYGGGSTDERVYFFNLADATLLQALQAKNPKQLTGGRMGSVLMIFDAKHPIIQNYIDTGVIFDESKIFYSFSGQKLAEQNYKQAQKKIGIPKETFIAHPFNIFNNTAKKVGEKLSREEETYATLLFIERMI